MKTKNNIAPAFTAKWMTELYTACYHDVACASDISSEDSQRDLELVTRRLASEGVSFFTKSLPLLGKQLDKLLSEFNHCGHVPPSFPGWELRPMTRYPRFLGNLFASVLAPDGSVRDDASPYALGQLRQMLYLFYKLEIPSTSEQNEKTLSDFMQTDASLPAADELPFNWVDSPVGTECSSAKDKAKNGWILRYAKNFVHRILGTYDPLDMERLAPRHGPGAVATGEKGHKKATFRRYYEHLHAVFPYDLLMSYNLSSVADEWEGWQTLESLRESTAKVVLVPKDSRGPRIISCEPLEVQWIQQALMTRLVDILESHPLTRGHVNFKSQEINRKLALSSSRPGSFQELGQLWVTMDMKDASDRVSLSLIRYLFPKSWVQALEACRSACTQLPDGRILRMKKFAPMGSAVCFPVEALVFYAICVAVLAYVSKDSRTDRQASTYHPYVYGDDLIVEDHLFDSTVSALESVHLKVNRDKCCTGLYFRESCGMDAFMGQTVTVLKIRRPLGSRSRTALFSWCEYHNWFSRHGFEGAARWIRQYLTPTRDATSIIVLDKYWLEAVGEEPGYAYLDVAGERPHALRGKMRVRYNFELQRTEVLAWGVTSRLQKRQVPGWSEMLSKASRRGHHLRRPVKGLDKLPSVFERTLAAKAYEYALAHGVVRKCAWYPLIGG